MEKDSLFQLYTLQMTAQVSRLFNKPVDSPVSFAEIIDHINTGYQFVPTAFRNGEAHNTSDQNQGSARVFAFAKLHQLDEQDTLSLFAEHYQSVLQDPQGINHQNIRQFMIHGWTGIMFEGEALVPK